LNSFQVSSAFNQLVPKETTHFDSETLLNSQAMTPTPTMSAAHQFKSYPKNSVDFSFLFDNFTPLLIWTSDENTSAESEFRPA
jgi:hypothetical protein